MTPELFWEPSTSGIELGALFAEVFVVVVEPIVLVGVVLVEEIVVLIGVVLAVEELVVDVELELVVESEIKLEIELVLVLVLTLLLIEDVVVEEVTVDD